MIIDKKHLEEKLALFKEEQKQALEQINQWSVIAARTEGAINSIQLLIKELEEN